MRNQLADELKDVAPALLLQGSARSAPDATGSSERVRRAGNVVILGVDDRFWNKAADRLPWPRP